MKEVAHFVSNAVLIFGILIATFLLIPLIPVADQWYQLAIVQSASMKPNLVVGSLAIYKAQVTYYPGEIIVYKSDEKLIIHRVVEKKIKDKQVFYLTQGDATQYLSSSPVFAGQVRGKLVGSVPQLGYVLVWFKSQSGIAAVIFVFLVLIIIGELIKLL